jgi:hypothetical protein
MYCMLARGALLNNPVATSAFGSGTTKCVDNFCGIERGDQSFALAENKSLQ